MIFTSTTRESVNRCDLHDMAHAKRWGSVRREDPEPWAHSFGFARSSDAQGAIQEAGVWEFEPRPQYRAPANPILTAFRAARAEAPGDFNDPEDWLANLEAMDPDAEWQGHIPEHVDHAVRVLEKLAAVANLAYYDAEIKHNEEDTHGR